VRNRVDLLVVLDRLIHNVDLARELSGSLHSESAEETVAMKVIFGVMRRFCATKMTPAAAGEAGEVPWTFDEGFGTMSLTQMLMTQSMDLDADSWFQNVIGGFDGFR
jgi:hypothetical protein